MRDLLPAGVMALLIAGAAGAQRGNAAGWRCRGGGGSTRCSPPDRTHRDDVGDPRVAWRGTSPDNEIAAVPAFTSLQALAAVDPGTGTTLWQYDLQP